jgi:hypothetical protein
MSRTYSDPSYGSEKLISFPATGSLAGTAAIAVKCAHTFMEPCTVTDMNVFFVAGGTTAAQSFVVGKSLAGTGTFAPIGTIVVGTQATNTIKDGAVTATSFNAGDDLVLYAGGTAAIVANGIVRCQYKETFVVSDN